MEHRKMRKGARGSNVASKKWRREGRRRKKSDGG